jgi:hypothetical protein
VGSQRTILAELHIDRAYLASTLVRDRDQDLQVFCKTFPVRNGPRFTKTAFGLDFDRGELTRTCSTFAAAQWFHNLHVIARWADQPAA